jgi:Holliday junction resolvase RusA-like endonuclease
MRFTVLGEPIPQGSLKAFTPKGWTRPILTNDNKKTKPWRQQVSQTCLESMKGGSPAGRKVPMRLMVSFYFSKPKGIKNFAEKVTRPDLDKCVRLVLDSLTGIAYEDDSQVIEIRADKQYGNPPRADIWVEEALPPRVAVPKADSYDLLPF